MDSGTQMDIFTKKTKLKVASVLVAYSLLKI